MVPKNGLPTPKYKSIKLKMSTEKPDGSRIMVRPLASWTCSTPLSFVNQNSDVKKLGYPFSIRFTMVWLLIQAGV
jgi:hypothetical protein